MKANPLDFLLVAIIALSLTPCVFELVRFSPLPNGTIVEGTVDSVKVHHYFGRRRLTLDSITVQYSYKTDDGFEQHAESTSALYSMGSERLNAPFTKGSTVVVEYDPSNPAHSMCSGLGWAFAGQHLFDAFCISVLALISLTLKAMTAPKETEVQMICENNRRDSATAYK